MDLDTVKLIAGNVCTLLFLVYIYFIGFFMLEVDSCDDESDNRIE